MGLDYSYLLYFKQEDFWDALQAVVRIAVPHDPPTRLLCPYEEFLIPLETWSSNKGLLMASDPELDFSTSLYFEEDDDIREYQLDLGNEEELRSPPIRDGLHRISIGYIYLTLYSSQSRLHPGGVGSDLMLFKFRTTGTRMSMLFNRSPSIRKTFTALLESVPGVCGVFDREYDAEAFWLRGRRISLEIDHAGLTPAEIEVEWRGYGL